MQLPPFTTFTEHTFQPNTPLVLDDIPKRVNLLTGHFESQVGFLRSHYPPDEAAVQIAIRAEQAANDLAILRAHTGDISKELRAHLDAMEAHFAQYRSLAAPQEEEQKPAGKSK